MFCGGGGAYRSFSGRAAGTGAVAGFLAAAAALAGGAAFLGPSSPESSSSKTPKKFLDCVAVRAKRIER